MENRIETNMERELEAGLHRDFIEIRLATA